MGDRVGFDKCWICEAQFPNPFPASSETIAIDCATCGQYQISLSKYVSAFPEGVDRHRLSFWNRQRQLEGREQIRLDAYSLPEILAALPDPRTHEKPDILLTSLSRLHQAAAASFRIDTWRERSLGCASSPEELSFYLDALIDSHYLAAFAGTARQYRITPRGWMRIAELAATHPQLSRIGFVALHFSSDILPLFKSAFAPAIRRAGFDPHLANDPAHNEQIDAKIVTELRQCRFVVADVTHARPNVYFEAGYALGLGRQVIWCVRDDRVRDAHFDVRQYNYIRWKESADLEEQLYYRISATI